MPRAAQETFPSGLVHREARKVWELLSDPARTEVIVVTIAEEMPVNETLDLQTRLQDELDMELDRIFLNGLYPKLFDESEVGTISKRYEQALIDKNPRQHAHFSRYLVHLQRMLSTIETLKERPEFDLNKIRAEDWIEYYQKANHFYWILGLHKDATPAQIEREYFRLI